MIEISPQIFQGRVVFVGVGNSLKGDDVAGLLLAERLRGQVEGVFVLADGSLENATSLILREKPNTIFLIDACHMNDTPGAWRVFTKDQINGLGFSTHDYSLKLWIHYAESQSNARIFVLGIQPQDVSLGAPVSKAVLDAIGELEEKIKEAFHARVSHY